MKTSFQYEKIGSSAFGDVYRPVAQAVFISPKDKKEFQVWMVVDTGADFTILPRAIAHDLSISLEKDCVKDESEGVGGTTRIYLCKFKIEAQIGKMKRKVPLAFFASNDLPPLLGRAGFMETFDVEFLKKHVVELKG